MTHNQSQTTRDSFDFFVKTQVSHLTKDLTPAIVPSGKKNEGQDDVHGAGKETIMVFDETLTARSMIFITVPTSLPL